MTREVLVEVVVVVKSVNKVITDGVFDVDSGMLVVVIAVGVVVWLGTGSTITGGCVGAPENVGSASGVANIYPPGPRISSAEFSTPPSSDAGYVNVGSMLLNWLQVVSPPPKGPLNVTATHAPAPF